MPAPSPISPDSSPASVADPAAVLEVLETILATELERVGPFTSETDLVKDLGLDSLELTVLAVGLENAFRIRLGEEDAGGLETVGDLVARVVERCRSGEAR